MKSSRSVKHFTIFLILAIAVLFAFSSCSPKAEAAKQSYNSPEVKAGQSTTCPVMGSKFTVKEDGKYAEVDGKKYYVCCPACIEKIEKDPDKYLKD